MNSTMGAIVLAGVAIALGLVALGVFLKARRAMKARAARRNSPEPAAPEPAPLPVAEPEPAPEPEPESELSHRFQVMHSDGVQQCLFVIFEWPALDTNRRLRTLLDKENAAYDARQGVYTLRDTRAGYRLTIADSTSPGRLPALHEPGEHPIVKGISILVHFRNKRRVANSPETLVRLTLAIADIGGEILDAERNPVDRDEFARLSEPA